MQALIKAGTDEEQYVLLESNERLVTIELRKRLVEKANSFASAHRIATALQIFGLVQRVSERIGDREGIALAQFGFGNVLRVQGDLDRALRHYRNAAAQFEAIGNKSQPPAGDAMAALSWGVFVAGCTASLVRQRHSDSAAATRLMVEFHRSLRSRPLTGPPRVRPAAALRQAVLGLIKDGRFDHPYHWAGFCVLGAGH